MSKKVEKREVVTVLSAKVAQFKLDAREALRMELISPRLARVSSYEDKIKNIVEAKEAHDHDIVVETYEISALDKNHPDYADTLEEREEDLESLKESLPQFAEDIKEVEKLIEEQKEAIQDIEHGKTLVSACALKELVNGMIERDAIVTVGK